jgi:hypothetical protein
MDWKTASIILALLGASVTAYTASGGGYEVDATKDRVSGGYAAANGYNLTQSSDYMPVGAAFGGGYTATVGAYDVQATTTTQPSSGGGTGRHATTSTTIPETTTTIQQPTTTTVSVTSTTQYPSSTLAPTQTTIPTATSMPNPEGPSGKKAPDESQNKQGGGGQGYITKKATETTNPKQDIGYGTGEGFVARTFGRSISATVDTIIEGIKSIDDAAGLPAAAVAAITTSILLPVLGYFTWARRRRNIFASTDAIRILVKEGALAKYKSLHCLPQALEQFPEIAERLKQVELNPVDERKAEKTAKEYKITYDTARSIIAAQKIRAKLGIFGEHLPPELTYVLKPMKTAHAEDEAA